MTESKRGSESKDRYKDTLNLPKTKFSMRAKLLQSEPKFQARWAKMELFEKILSSPHPKGKFPFHDGPPYANGSIHMGHLLNKVLKDIVVRSKTMDGYAVNFVPGWDCHGLPIEHKVMQELSEKERAEMPALKIRKKCHRYAEKYIKLQSKQLLRLGTLGDYKAPYITMDPNYEAGVLEVFADLVEQGLVFRALKPVHWSIANRTALAEAELEYRDRKDPSIYVNFEIVSPSKLPASLNAPSDKPISLMIWTTTPWTLPANLAVAAAPSADYALYRYKIGELEKFSIVAEALAENVFKAGDISEFKLLGRCKGRELAERQISYLHPIFEDKVCPVVLADYVTLEDGTGLVHTAPGHGEEDYSTGLKEGLDIYCPVREDGTYDDTVPNWLRGMDVWTANGEIVKFLKDKGLLFTHSTVVHSYPHDWRSKTPTIFRATNQWFIGVDRPIGREGKSLRQKALESLKEIKFIPSWGESRLRGMLESRPDWCISRQRAWGLPIPIFYHPDTQEPLLTAVSVRAIAKKIREKGSDLWFYAPSEEILSHYEPSSDPDAPDWAKEVSKSELLKGSDIFDVWFESGSSWFAVMHQRDLGVPSEIYLEGSDQHRGWFQLSLLPALGSMGKPPFKMLLTHGFIVDAEGKKMSKSLGNSIEVEELLAKYGADICRWWVSSLNYINDIKVDWKFFKLATEEYRKVRNTIRFILGNLGDFDPKKDWKPLADEDRYTLDAWAGYKLNQLIDEVLEAYRNYQFRRVNKALFDFCNDSMSAVYLAAIKDRLYCDSVDSPRRRRTQTLLYQIADALIKLLAPILVHTAEEAFLYLNGYDLDKDIEHSVHLQNFPEKFTSPAIPSDWEQILTLRSKVLKALEVAKDERGINYPLDAGISATVSAELYRQLTPYLPELADLCGVSRFQLQEGSENIQIEVIDLRDEPRCQRSWKRDGTVKLRSDGGMLSDRDAEVLGVK